MLPKRVAGDPAFLHGGIDVMLSGDVDAGKALLAGLGQEAAVTVKVDPPAYRHGSDGASPLSSADTVQRRERRVVSAGELTDAETVLIAQAEASAEHGHLDREIDSLRP